jgi:hypothetical protein
MRLSAILAGLEPGADADGEAQKQGRDIVCRPMPPEYPGIDDLRPGGIAALDPARMHDDIRDGLGAAQQNRRCRPSIERGPISTVPARNPASQVLQTPFRHE